MKLTLISDTTEALDDLYARLEPQILANPVIRAELADTGIVRLRTLQQQLGLPEGQAAFVARTIERKHGDRTKYYASQAKQYQAAKAADKDNYLYHITTARRARQIKSRGLVPGSTAQFTNYRGYSSDRIFLCEKGGVPFWKERVEQHEHANHDHPSTVIGLRVDRTKIPNLLPDTIGTQDSGHPSYYIVSPVKPADLETVKY